MRRGSARSLTSSTSGKPVVVERVKRRDLADPGKPARKIFRNPESAKNDDAAASESLIAQAQSATELPSPFGSYRQLCDRLARGYPLYRACQDNAELAATVCSLPALSASSRKKKPSPKRMAVLITCLVCNAEDEPQRKMCSEWSNLLKYAQVEGISADGFLAWSETVTVAEGIKKCRTPRAKRPPATPEGNPPPASNGGWLSALDPRDYPDLAAALARSDTTDSSYAFAFDLLKMTLTRINERVRDRNAEKYRPSVSGMVPRRAGAP